MNAITKPKAKLLLESKSCGRCGGSGSYSWNARNGSTCFGCGGRGEVLTKRGAAAQAYLDSLSMVRAGDLKPGDQYWDLGVTNGCDVYGYWAKVVSVEHNAEGKLILNTTSKYGNSGLQCDDGHVVKKARSAEEVAETRRLALAFQCYLTKSGAVAKSTIDVVLS